MSSSLTAAILFWVFSGWILAHGEPQDPRRDPQDKALCDLCASTNLCTLTTVSGWSCTGGAPDSALAVCDWEGVTCDVGISRAVTALDLAARGLVGTIPNSVGHLSRLKIFRVTGNYLSGSIPAGVGSLSELIRLDMGDNRIAGSLPAGIAKLSNLVEISASLNRLTGCIPLSVARLARVALMDLSHNAISGSLSAAVGGMPSLRALLLSGNRVSGSVPASIGSLTNLISLFLNNNRIDGEIPTAIGQSCSLIHVDLSDNCIVGSIPLSLGSLTNIGYLSLQHNALNGSIPRSVSALSRLEQLHLQSNSLTGSLPAALGDLSSLCDFTLLRNAFTGAIPLGVEFSPVLSMAHSACPTPLGVASLVVEDMLHLNSLLSKRSTDEQRAGMAIDSFAPQPSVEAFAGHHTKKSGVPSKQLPIILLPSTFNNNIQSYYEPSSRHSCRPTPEPTGFQVKVENVKLPVCSSETISRRYLGVPIITPTKQVGVPPYLENPADKILHPSRIFRTTERGAPTPPSPTRGDPVGLPSGQPSSAPSMQPSVLPTGMPRTRPSGLPSVAPSVLPSNAPSGKPSSQPSGRPSGIPSRHPTTLPSGEPSMIPPTVPSSLPSGLPSEQPSGRPSVQPSCQPTGDPSSAPSSAPSVRPSGGPSMVPSVQPSALPTAGPTGEPTSLPSRSPSGTPSVHPTSCPSGAPSAQPTGTPSLGPTREPSAVSSCEPSCQPSASPSGAPTVVPSRAPSAQPSGTPSRGPSGEPSGAPTSWPSGQPTMQPSGEPTTRPSDVPSRLPTAFPSGEPSAMPSGTPSGTPTMAPTSFPSEEPSAVPSGAPSVVPSDMPFAQPTGTPSELPTVLPSEKPSCSPSAATNTPTNVPPPTSLVSYYSIYNFGVPAYLEHAGATSVGVNVLIGRVLVPSTLFSAAVLFTDSCGGVTYAARIDLPDSWQERFTAMILLAEGEVLIVGEGTYEGKSIGLLSRFDMSGTHIETTGMGWEDHVVFTFATRVSGDRILYVGYTAEGISYRDVLVALSDLSGNLHWAFKFGSYAQDAGHSAAETSSGFVVVGVHNSGHDGVILMLNDEGDLTFQKSLSGTELRSVHATRDGGYIAVGSITVAGRTLGLSVSGSHGGEILNVIQFELTNSTFPCIARSAYEVGNGDFAIIFDAFGDPSGSYLSGVVVVAVDTDVAEVKNAFYLGDPTAKYVGRSVFGSPRGGVNIAGHMKKKYGTYDFYFGELTSSLIFPGYSLYNSIPDGGFRATHLLLNSVTVSVQFERSLLSSHEIISFPSSVCVPLDVTSDSNPFGEGCVVRPITPNPTAKPTESAPTVIPSVKPITTEPTAGPTSDPTARPVTSRPSQDPTTVKPSIPGDTNKPTVTPTVSPTAMPSEHPTKTPSVGPSAVPTTHPSRAPTAPPTSCPSTTPSRGPTPSTTNYPSSIRSTYQPTSVVSVESTEQTSAGGSGTTALDTVTGSVAAMVGLAVTAAVLVFMIGNCCYCAKKNLGLRNYRDNGAILAAAKPRRGDLIAIEPSTTVEKCSADATVSIHVRPVDSNDASEGNQTGLVDVVSAKRDFKENWKELYTLQSSSSEEATNDDSSGEDFFHRDGDYDGTSEIFPEGNLHSFNLAAPSTAVVSGEGPWRFFVDAECRSDEDEIEIKNCSASESLLLSKTDIASGPPATGTKGRVHRRFFVDVATSSDEDEIEFLTRARVDV